MGTVLCVNYLAKQQQQQHPQSAMSEGLPGKLRFKTSSEVCACVCAMKSTCKNTNTMKIK